MKTQDKINFDRIAAAIKFIKENFKQQPSLEDIATYVNLSPFHFQRLFSDWAGTSPKRFLQFVSINYAKKLLKQDQATLFDTAMETGLSGTSRLHDLFVNIEGMTPGEYKNGGEHLNINYSFAESPFGHIIVASTAVGICHLAFYNEESTALKTLQSHFPNACYKHITDLAHQEALFIFNHDWSKLNQIKLHLRGTDFQLKVWETLLKIPMGQISSYGQIARQLQNQKASRAVGTAIGSNPVAFLIPCHRVIQASGALGGYHWGLDRKTAMIAWEASKIYAGGD